jgi:hypothetical protein
LGTGDGEGTAGLDRAQIERRVLEELSMDEGTPLDWLTGADGLVLAEELLGVAKEPQGDLSKARYEERVKGRVLEVLALSERSGSQGGEDGGS